MAKSPFQKFWLLHVYVRIVLICFIVREEGCCGNPSETSNWRTTKGFCALIMCQPTTIAAFSNFQRQARCIGRSWTILNTMNCSIILVANGKGSSAKFPNIELWSRLLRRWWWSRNQYVNTCRVFGVCYYIYICILIVFIFKYEL